MDDSIQTNIKLDIKKETDRHVFKLNKQYLACDRQKDIKNNLIGYVWQTDRHVFKLNKQYLACDRQKDRHKKQPDWLCVTDGQTCI